MKKEVMERWVVALRAGKYEQGIGVLRSADNKYCCLGVLCDILGAQWTEPSDDSHYTVGYDTTFLPVSIAHQASMRSGDGELVDSLSLVKLNDTGKNFNEIADIIEQNWEQL